MVSSPTRLIRRNVKAGASILTLHYEAYENKNDLLKAIHKIKSYGIKAGVSISPETPFKAIKEIAKYLDLVLIMSVVPGKSGQEFIHTSLVKILAASDFKRENKLNFLLEVDGGINNENAKQIIVSGANILVSGSYLYNSANKTVAIKALRGK